MKIEGIASIFYLKFGQTQEALDTHNGLILNPQSTEKDIHPKELVLLQMNTKLSFCHHTCWLQEAVRLSYGL